MKYILIIGWLGLSLQVSAQADFELCSWNIANFGKSKTPEVIKYIATTIKGYDVVAIIEVVAGKGGPEAVEALKKELNKSGKKWDYVLSEPTTSKMKGSERYAVFWKTAKLQRYSSAGLEKVFAKQIDREPFMVGFKVPDGQSFTVAAFHAVPTEKDPAKEIRLLEKIPGAYPQKNIIFCGDFNLSGTNEAFDPIKLKKYGTVFTDQKTSLKKDCDDNDCLASVYDNILYRPLKQEAGRSGIIKFYEDFDDYAKAKKVSDHVPVFARFILN